MKLGERELGLECWRQEGGLALMPHRSYHRRLRRHRFQLCRMDKRSPALLRRICRSWRSRDCRNHTSDSALLPHQIGYLILQDGESGVNQAEDIKAEALG